MIRIGIGYDVHRLTEGRDLILGGMKIPYEKGLAGHSDADVLIHAVIDALLGAAGMGDIGKLFPDTDGQYKDIDSGLLLREVKNLLQKSNKEIGNIDAVIIAQAPKLAPYITGMRKKISQILDVSSDIVSIKATTTEKLGFAGRGEGIAAEAVALIHQH